MAEKKFRFVEHYDETHEFHQYGDSPNEWRQDIAELMLRCEYGANIWWRIDQLQPDGSWKKYL